MKAIVHLGLPKTGTTSIQIWLKSNVEALRARGLHYDRIKVEGVPLPHSQLEVAVCALDRAGRGVPNPQTRRVFRIGTPEKQAAFAADMARRFEASVRATRPGETYLISSEHLGAWVHAPDTMEALRDWLAQYFDEVRYIVYIRRQEDWLLSRYSQHLRRGHATPLDVFMREQAVHDYGRQMLPWAETVGRANFDLRIMEREALVGGDLIADFAHALGISAEGLPVPERQNESLTLAAAEFMRVMNDTLVPLVPVAGGGTLRNPLMRGVDKRLTEQHAGARRMRVTRSQAEQIRAVNAESNERLRAAFFPDREHLFPPRPLPDVEDDANTPTPEEMARVGLDLYRAARTFRLPKLTDQDLAGLKAALRERKEARTQGRGKGKGKGKAKAGKAAEGAGKARRTAPGAGKAQGKGKGKGAAQGKGGARSGGWTLGKGKKAAAMQAARPAPSAADLED